jgi:hypothetical protein
MKDLPSMPTGLPSSFTAGGWATASEEISEDNLLWRQYVLFLGAMAIGISRIYSRVVPSLTQMEDWLGYIAVSLRLPGRVDLGVIAVAVVEQHVGLPGVAGQGGHLRRPLGQLGVGVAVAEPLVDVFAVPLG